MANILIISPISIAGELILKGFKKGFDNNNAHNTTFVDVRELKNLPVCDFDFVLSYDYGYMINDDALNFVQNLIKSNKNIKLIHYFADNPLSNYSLSGDLSLKEKFEQFIDNHKRNVELIFWDKKYLNDFKNTKSKYFPICVDCEIYKDLDLEKKYDITFLGRPLSDIRQEILSVVIKNFPDKLKIFSYPKHFETSVDQMKKYLSNDELLNYKNSFRGFISEQNSLSKVYNMSKINLNINLQGESSLNYRTFEVLACGGFLLCDKRDDIKNLDLEDVIVCYEDKNDLIDKIKYYLNNPLERKKISARARKLIYERYNIISKANEILNIVE